MSAAIGQRDRAAIIAAKELLSDPCRHGGVYPAALQALKLLIGSAEPLIYRWTENGKLTVLCNAMPALTLERQPWPPRSSALFLYDRQQVDRLGQRVMTLTALSRGQPEASNELRREVLAWYGVRHQLRVLLYDRHEFLAWVGYSRPVSSGDFTEAESVRLEGVIGPLRALLAVSHAVNYTALEAEQLTRVLDMLPQSAFLLAPDGKALFANTSGRSSFSDLASILADCVREPLAATGLGVRLTRLDFLGRSVYLAIVVRAPARLPRSPWKLPPRLAGVCEQLLLGKSDKDIAARFGLSTASVSTYCREIYRRTGVRGRAELMRAAGAIGGS